MFSRWSHRFKQAAPACLGLFPTFRNPLREIKSLSTVHGSHCPMSSVQDEKARNKMRILKKIFCDFLFISELKTKHDYLCL